MSFFKIRPLTSKRERMLQEEEYLDQLGIVIADAIFETLCPEKSILLNEVTITLPFGSQSSQEKSNLLGPRLPNGGIYTRE